MDPLAASAGTSVAARHPGFPPRPPWAIAIGWPERNLVTPDNLRAHTTKSSYCRAVASTTSRGESPQCVSIGTGLCHAFRTKGGAPTYAERVMPVDPKECRKHAQFCTEQAAAARSARSKTLFLELTQSWKKLEDTVAKRRIRRRKSESLSTRARRSSNLPVRKE